MKIKILMLRDHDELKVGGMYEVEQEEAERLYDGFFAIPHGMPNEIRTTTPVGPERTT